jgi:hypothetical protein
MSGLSGLTGQRGAQRQCNSERQGRRGEGGHPGHMAQPRLVKSAGIPAWAARAAEGMRSWGLGLYVMEGCGQFTNSTQIWSD